MGRPARDHQNSDRERLLGHKATNPLYLVLSSHLLARSRVFRQQKDLYNYLWAVLPYAEEHKNRGASDFIADELSEIGSKGSAQITTETLLTFALGVKVLRLQGVRENEQISGDLKALLRESETKSWLNAPEAISILTFSLVHIEDYELWVKNAAEWLDGLWLKAAKSSAQSSARLIDLLFGLTMANRAPGNIPYHLLVKDLSKHSIEKVSKLVISLKQLGRESELRAAIQTLQGKLSAVFGQWYLPETELALLEGAHIAASGLSEEDTQQILSNLKKEGVPWAQRLDVTERTIALTDVEAERTPDMSAGEQSLSIAALKAVGLDEGYYLSGSEHRIATESVKIAGRGAEFIAASKRGLSTIAWLSVFTAIFSFVVGATGARQVLDYIASGTSLLEALRSLFTTNFSLLGILAVLYILYIILYIRIIFIFRSKGTVLRWWELIPGLRWLSRQLRLIEAEKED